jgi:hypothetical protein
VTDAEAFARLAAERSRLDALGPVDVVAIGYATVDLDRAANDARSTIAHAGPTEAADDPLLGARCRLLTAATGPLIVLLEPYTEGPLSGALARFGEGAIVEYVITVAPLGARAAEAGIRLSSAADGPFGRSRLVVGGPRWGPYLIVLDDDAPDGGRSAAATIER